MQLRPVRRRASIPPPISGYAAEPPARLSSVVASQEALRVIHLACAVRKRDLAGVVERFGLVVVEEDAFWQSYSIRTTGLWMQ